MNEKFSEKILGKSKTKESKAGKNIDASELLQYLSELLSRCKLTKVGIEDVLGYNPNLE